MRKPVFVILSVLALVLSTPSQVRIPKNSSVSTMDGRQLLEACTAGVRAVEGIKVQSDDFANMTKCMYYIRGFADGFFAAAIRGNLSNASQFCVPPQVTNEELMRVVKKWIEDNPTKLHWSAAIVVLSALDEGFPCS